MNIRVDFPRIYGNVCPSCGGYKSESATLCNTCHRAYPHRNKPSRDTLKFLIRWYPFTTIAKKCDVSDSTVKVWCKQYGLPHLKRDINKYTDSEWRFI